MISNLQITTQNDSNRYYMLAQLMFKFCLSDQEIVTMSDYQNIKTLRIDQKYLKLSGTLRLKDACQYPNLIQHRIVDAATQMITSSNSNKFSNQLNLYHDILMHGYSIDNLIWWALYQHQHHYSITDMIEYFNFNRQLYTAALKFYGLPQVIFLPLNGRKQLVKELAEKYRDDTQFQKYINILSSDVDENYQHLTYRDVARIYQWPTEIYKDVLRQLLTKEQLIHIAAMSGINKSIKTNMRRYGVKFPLQSQEIMKRNEQTVLKRYGVKSVLQDKQIYSKIAKDSDEVNRLLVDFSNQYEPKLPDNFNAEFDRKLNILLKQIDQVIKDLSDFYATSIKNKLEYFSTLSDDEQMKYSAEVSSVYNHQL